MVMRMCSQWLCASHVAHAIAHKPYSEALALALALAHGGKTATDQPVLVICSTRAHAWSCGSGSAACSRLSTAISIDSACSSRPHITTQPYEKKKQCFSSVCGADRCGDLAR
eukprot:2559457-Pleurochrysis_carterae.AAC.5